MRKLEYDWLLLIKDCEESHRIALRDAARAVYASCALSIVIDACSAVIAYEGKIFPSLCIALMSAFIIWAGIDFRKIHLCYANRQLVHRQDAIDHLRQYREAMKAFEGM